MVKFIHCADIHLGKIQFRSAERFEDFFNSFKQIVDFAIENKVDFVLISGDFFNYRNINSKTLDAAVNLLKELQVNDIEVIAVEGNHDKAYYIDECSWLEFLKRQGFLKLLKSTFDSESNIILKEYDEDGGNVYTKNGIKFLGIGYLGSGANNKIEQMKNVIKEDENYVVALLHAGIDKLMHFDGIKSSSFEGLDTVIDYFALGHIHSREEKQGRFYNPGAPENVDINEFEKEKGFYYAEVINKKADIKFIPTERRKVEFKNIDITGFSKEIVEEKIIGELNNLTPKSILKIILTGNVDFSSYALNFSNIANNIKNHFGLLYVEIENKTNLPKSIKNHVLDNNIVEKEVFMTMVEQRLPEYDKERLAALSVYIKDNFVNMNDIDILEEISKITVEFKNK